MNQAAYVLRIAPSGVDKVPEALNENQIIIGWASATGLLDSNLDWWKFREIIHQKYYSEDENYRGSGSAGGHMWRFIRDMNAGDLVVVPHGPHFYVAKITGAATYDPRKIDDDSAYRRQVQWLNNKKPIPREMARSALISRMKTQGTTANATDLLDSMLECISAAEKGRKPTFETDLQERLTKEVLSELRSGRMDSYKFEELIRTVLIGLGAKDAYIVPRSQDKGADIVAKFRIAGAFDQIVAVQAKHWQPEPPVHADVVDKLVEGMQAELATWGMVLTCGTIGEDAEKAAESYGEKGFRIELVDGEQFAKLIVEQGVRIFRHQD